MIYLVVDINFDTYAVWVAERGDSNEYDTCHSDEYFHADINVVRCCACLLSAQSKKTGKQVVFDVAFF